jgi:hypothetical protein
MIILGDFGGFSSVVLSKTYEMMTTRNPEYYPYNYVKIHMSLTCRKNEHEHRSEKSL